MDLTDFSLRKGCSPGIFALIREIIESPKLHYGAKVLGIALLDLPPKKKPTDNQLAFKIKASYCQIALWRQELLRNGFRIR